MIRFVCKGSDAQVSKKFLLFAVTNLRVFSLRCKIVYFSLDKPNSLGWSEKTTV